MDVGDIADARGGLVGIDGAGSGAVVLQVGISQLAEAQVDASMPAPSPS